MDRPTFHLAQGDAVDWLRSLPAESVDLAVTDPPYESLEKHRAIGTTTRLKHSKASSNDWFRVFPNGGLKLLGNTAVRKNEFALTDETLSSDSRYLYVLSTGASPATHHIDEYKVGGNGILTLIGQTPAMAVPGASGLVGS